jgi:hypothetical protein
MEMLPQDEFYRHMLDGYIPDGPAGEPPFWYERIPRNGTSRMVLFGKPIIHFKILDQVEDGYLVSVNFDEAVPIEGPGTEETFVVETQDIHELHQALAQYGEQAVRVYTRLAAEHYFRRSVT